MQRIIRFNALQMESNFSQIYMYVCMYSSLLPTFKSSGGADGGNFTYFKQ